MNPLKFSPKDAKIIRDNPGKSPDELLELGLSLKAFARLPEPSDKMPAPVAASPIIIPVSVQSAAKEIHGNTVKLKRLKEDTVVEMGFRSAQMLASKYPKEFRII